MEESLSFENNLPVSPKKCKKKGEKVSSKIDLSAIFDNSLAKCMTLVKQSSYTAEDELSKNVSKKEKRKKNETVEYNLSDEESLPKKKKKKSKDKKEELVISLNNGTLKESESEESNYHKKKKKKKLEEEVISPESEIYSSVHGKSKVKSNCRKNKKKKVSEVEDQASATETFTSNDSPKIIKAKRKKSSKHGKVSIAIPASILEKTIHKSLQTTVIGQVSRAACIFAVKEIVVYDDHCWRQPKHASHYIEMMRIILSYQECPQYLRKSLFGYNKHLKNSGVLNPLNAPHHLRDDEWCNYREGVVLEGNENKCSSVDVGFKKSAQVDKKLKSGARVTVKFPPEAEHSNNLYGEVVSPDEPNTSDGLYWGYTVRVANSLYEALRSKNEYDLIIGTSDKGDDALQVELPRFKHALLVFGSAEGLEASMKADPSVGESNPRNLFDLYLNTCPLQKSRTIRTEEALWISLSLLSFKMSSVGIY